MCGTREGSARKIHTLIVFFFFFQAEDGIRDLTVTGVQTCALPILIWQKYQSDLEVNGSTGGERMPAWSRRIFEKEIRSGRADTNGRESCHNYDSKVSALEEMGSHNRQDS